MSRFVLRFNWGEKLGQLELAFSVPSLSILAAAGLIFVLRLLGVAIGTLRFLVMMRGLKLASAALGFFEVLVYVIAIGKVVNDLGNVWNVLGYCLGFSAGTVVGMWLDERYVLGFANVRIVTRKSGQAVASAIHAAGYGATVEWGSGRDGPVAIVTAMVRRKEISDLFALADGADPGAFVTVEEARAVRRGFLHATHREK